MEKRYVEKLKLIAEKDPTMAAMLLQNITGKFALLPGEQKKVEEERNMRLAATNVFGGALHPTCLGAQAYQWEDGMQWLIDTSGGMGWDDGKHWLAKRWLHRLKTSRSLRQTALGLPSRVAVGREDDEFLDELQSALNMKSEPTAASHDERQAPDAAATSQERLELGEEEMMEEEEKSEEEEEVVEVVGVEIEV